jgi:hypothetical protein
MRKVLVGSDRVKAKLVGISRDASGWRLLDRAGVIHHIDGRTWEVTGTSRVEFGAGIIQRAEGDGAGGFALLIRRMGTQGRGTAESTLLVAGPDGVVHAGWRAALAGTPASHTLALSRVADGWMIAGVEPPRLLYFDRHGMLIEERQIHRVAARPMSRAVLDEFERLAGSAGLSGARLPPYFPPITAVRPYGNALLAVPYVGGPTGEAQGLDVYCNDRYSHTVLDAPNLQQVLITDHGVVAVVENSRMSYSIQYYRSRDLPLTCEASR